MALKYIHCVFQERETLSLFILLFICVVQGQVRYTIPEEMDRGSVVGNIAEDLGITVKRLKSGRARVVNGDSSRYVELDADKGILSVNERIDRELLCKKVSPCSFSVEIILENPIQLFEVIVEIKDVNDHSPAFSKDEINIEISEASLPGARFLLDSAFDPDVGVNTVQSYILKPTENFVLKHESRSDGSRYLEMMLQSPVDREMREELSLVLTAVDGGNPQKSGVMKINIKVLDVNDNAPVFTKKVYRATVPENSPKGTLVTKVSAMDADKGVNGKITYSLRQAAQSDTGMFEIDGRSGEIFVLGNIDFEIATTYEINIEGKDFGGMTDSCAVIIDIIDMNDNIPVISMTSFTNRISEDALPGTTVAVINVKDSDSGESGHVKCIISQNSPFTIESSLRNYYTLQTGDILDRESVSEYNITIIATDEGSPPLSSKKTLHLKVSDVNDNPPVFQKRVYFAYMYENNSPSVSIFTVSATDTDCCQNARVSYLLEDTEISGARASSLVSVNSESGIIHAARSFDYEQLREFEINIRAQDGGSPPLSSNVTVKIFIQDQNDNAPQILYPLQIGVSQFAEMVPRSADAGYLVTKVVAVDVDSGQNAWLSYKLLKATDKALFEIGLLNGEIRTVRPVTDKDAVKQRLTVVVEDNGQPSHPATVNVNVAVTDSFPEVLSEFTDFTHDKDYNDNMTFYLVLALAAVSFLFISTLVVIISVKIYRWRQSRIFYQSSLPVIPYYPPRYADSEGTGTLQQVYNYEVCMTTDSRKSDIKYLRPISQSLISVDVSSSDTMLHVKKEKNLLESTDSPVEQKTPSDWNFAPNQRPGTSGKGRFQSTQERWPHYGNSRADPRPEEAGAITGTSPWPNPPTEAEQLQALMAAANEVNDATATLGHRYNPQFALQHVPDYRQNVYIPGSTATLTANQQQPPQPALPQPPPQADPPKPVQTPASKKKSAKKDKK